MRTVGLGTPIRGPAASGAASWQGSVKDKDLTAPPGSPVLGDRYIVASPATGAWSGEENSIAEWDGSAWIFDTPVGGWTVWVDDESEIYVFNGSSWGQESFGPHAATHTSGGDKLPNSNAGDLLQHSGSQWDPAQFAAAGTEFLVGPAGTAKYTSIQAAINAASPGDIVYVLPGTYVEDLYISRNGVIVEAVVPVSSRILGPGRISPTVTIQGYVSVYVEDDWETRLSGLKIQPSSGNAFSISFAYSVQHIFILQLYNCEIVGVSAEPFYLGTQGVTLKVDAFNTSFARTDSGTCLTLSHYTHDVSLESCSVKTGSTVAVDVSANAVFRMHDSLGHEEGLIGRLNISGDALVQLIDVRISPSSGDHIVVTPNLLGTDSFWHNVLGGNGTDECQSITISGANAETFVERPKGIVRRNIQTTDATVTTIATIYIPDDTVVWIETSVINRRTNAADRGKWKRGALVYREAAGAATLEGAVWTPLSIKSVLPAQWDVTITVSGNNALIHVTGLAGHDINWESRHTVEERS